MTSIIKDWASDLGLRHQGVLVSAVRGCDSVPREDPLKDLTRFYRACLLRAHVGDPRKASSYMVWFDSDEDFWESANRVIKSHDHYPIHYLLHFLHAVEIMGYKMPVDPKGSVGDLCAPMWWRSFYFKMCHKLHFNPEAESQLDARLNADEATFASQQ